MKQLYADIKAKIEAKVPEIKFIHIWNNQFELQEGQEIYSFPYPCLFVEFVAPEELQQLGQGYQLYENLLVRIHIGHQQLDAADGTQEQNLDVFDLKDKVYKALQKFEPTGAVAFVRKTETQDYTHTNVYHFIQEYITNYVDANKKEPFEGIVKNPPTNMDIELTKEGSVDTNEPYIIPIIP